MRIILTILLFLTSLSAYPGGCNFISKSEKESFETNTKDECFKLSVIKLGPATQRSTIEFIETNGVVTKHSISIEEEKLMPSKNGVYYSPIENFYYINESPKNGFLSPFLIFIPKNLYVDQTGKARIHVVPNNTGRTTDDFNETKKNTLNDFKWYTAISERPGTILLMPIFPREKSNWLVYTHALDRDVFLTEIERLNRLDKQLLNMVDAAMEMLNEANFGQKILVNDKILVSGFSASGQFASRLPYLFPERIKASLFGSPGGFPMLPIKSYNQIELRYPLGLADFEKLTGMPFNKNAFEQVKMIHYLGDADTNDAVPFKDAFDDEDRDLIYRLFGKTPISRWALVDNIFKEEHKNFSSHLINGAGHNLNTDLLFNFLISNR